MSEIALPKIDSSILHFTPKKKFLNLNNPKNLELVTRIFFNHRRKMLKKPFNQLFNGNEKILQKLNINLIRNVQIIIKCTHAKLIHVLHVMFFYSTNDFGLFGFDFQ